MTLLEVQSEQLAMKLQRELNAGSSADYDSGNAGGLSTSGPTDHRVFGGGPSIEVAAQQEQQQSSLPGQVSFQN